MTHLFRRVCQACPLVMFLPVAHAQPVTPSPDHLQLYRSRDCAQLKTSGAELEELFKRSEAQWNRASLPNSSADMLAYEQRLRREGLAELGQKNAAARAALAMAIAEKQCDNPASGVAPSPAPRPLVVEAAGANTPGAPSPGGPAQPVIPNPVDLQIYRSRDCARLKTSAAELEEIYKRIDANGPRTDQWYVENVNSRGPARVALALAIAEKQCDFAPSAATPSPAPGAVQPAKPPVAGLLPQIGAKVDAVSPGFAQSLGLKQVRGALVVEVEVGSNADEAGLRALDVIIEITGQAVQGPDDLRETLSRMRPGFKASLRVWRSKTMRDVAVEISESSRP